MKWFISDLHFCHDRSFIYKPRGFNSVQEMNETLLSNIKEKVSWNDELYILGDCFLNDNEEGMRLMKQLPGTKYIIWGNHDTDARKKLLMNAGINFISLGHAHILKYKGYSFYLCHYPTMTSNNDYNKPLERRMLSISGHTHLSKIWDEAGGYNVAPEAHKNYPVSIEEIIEAFKKREEERYEFKF